jgi:hypothetical protein
MDILPLEDLVEHTFTRLKRPFPQPDGVPMSAPIARFAGRLQSIGHTSAVNPINGQLEIAEAYIVRGDNGFSYIATRICSSGIVKLNRYFRRRD